MNKRIYYMDVARVCALIGMILVHIDAMSWYDAPMHPYPWLIYNIFDSFGRFSVPIFLMISGFLFLNPEREVTIPKLYTKYIKRIVIAFFFWSFLYAIITSGFATQRRLSAEIVQKFLQDLFYGRYHMWYLCAILGLYMVTPVLRCIARDRNILRYFLVLSFVVAYLLPTLQMIPILSGTTHYTYRIDISAVSGYSFYFLMGYYLGTRDIEKKEEKWWYLAGILGLITVYVSTSIMCLSQQYADGRMTECLTAGVCLYACGTFVFFKQKFAQVNPEGKWMKVVRFLASISLGIYLASDFGIIVMKKIGLTPASFHPALSVVALAFADLLISVIIASIIRKIPVIGKIVT